jgi:hypothetical protein
MKGKDNSASYAWIATQVIYDGVVNNKYLLLAGGVLGLACNALADKRPHIDMGNVWNSFASVAPYTPYLKAAVAGAAIIGIGKVLLDSFCKRIEKAAKHAPDDEITKE